MPYLKQMEGGRTVLCSTVRKINVAVWTAEHWIYFLNIMWIYRDVSYC